jgi:hypothetical protein
MKILWEKTPVWFDNGQPVINTVRHGYKAGLLKMPPPEDPGSGFDFEAEFKSWYDGMKYGSNFSFQTWLDHAMEESSGSGMDKIQATAAWRKLAPKVRKRFVARATFAQGPMKVWEKV